MKGITGLCFISLLSFSAVAQEANQRVQSLDLNGIQAVAPRGGFLKELILKYLPRGLSPTENRDEAAQELQKNLTRNVGEDIFNSPFFTKNSVGKLVSDVKKFSSHSMVLVSSHQPQHHEPLKFDVDASRAQAGINYSGIFTSALRFVGIDHNFQLIISTEICKNSHLSVVEEMPVSGSDISSHLDFGYQF